MLLDVILVELVLLNVILLRLPPMMDCDFAPWCWRLVRSLGELQVLVSLGEIDRGILVQKFVVWLVLIEKKRMWLVL